MKKNLDSKKCITAAVLLLVAILSITVVGKYASAPENHQKTIASLDEKKQTVMELTAASTVTSALITLLPGDTATPIAEKMADVSGYLLVVLCAIYLEKYLVTITGYVAFTYLIPIACGLWILNLIFANATVRKLAAKLAVFGLAISLVVPASVKISDLIGDTYQAQIEATIEDAKNTQNILENSGVADDTDATETTEIGTTEASGTVTGNVHEKENNNSGSVSNIFDWAKDAISGAKDSVANVVENVTISTEDLVQKVENSLNHFDRGGCRDDHYFLRDPDAGAVTVLLDGEDRAGCGSEWREDQGDATGAEGIEVISQINIPHLATDFFVPIRVDTDEYRKNYIAY